jgi:hypothetical protein
MSWRVDRLKYGLDLTRSHGLHWQTSIPGEPRWVFPRHLIIATKDNRCQQPFASVGQASDYHQDLT